MKEYDLIVVGGGGGLKIARPAADKGYRVAVIEKGPLGGTCLNRGCIPSKMLIHVADLLSYTRELTERGAKIPSLTPPEFAQVVEEVNSTIDHDSQSVKEAYTKHAKIDLYSEKAQFISPKVLQVGNKKITAKKIFLAVGAKPKIPKIPGLDKTPFMTYKEALRCTTKPKKLVVIGGGYIAVELGYFYARMGVDVTFLVRGALLSHADSTIQEGFTQAFEKQFTCHKGLDFQKVEYTNGQFSIFASEQEFKADALLVATGVEPQTQSLGLEHTSIRTDAKGFILTNDYLQTTQQGVWALGDCIGRYLFRHSVNFEGEYLLAHAVLQTDSSPIQYPQIPHAVFSYPQIGSVGKTEEQLRQEKVDYFVAINRYQESAMGMALQDPYGLVKLLFDKKSRKLLGAHILGVEAASLIHTLIVFMHYGAKAEDLLKIVYIHPALAEVVRNAARKAVKQLSQEG